MERPAANAEAVRKIQQTSPSDTNQVTKNETKGQRETLQNNKDVMSPVRLIKAVRLPANHLATVSVQLTHVKGTVY